MLNNEFNLVVESDKESAVNTVDAMLFNDESLHMINNAFSMRKVLDRWQHQINNVESDINNFVFEFTTVYYSNLSSTYFVSITPDFAPLDDLGFPHGVNVLFRNFLNKEKAEKFASDLNLIFNKSFKYLKKSKADPDTIPFIKTLSFDNESIIYLSPEIFECDERITLAHFQDADLTQINNFIKDINNYFIGCYKEYLEELAQK